MAYLAANLGIGAVYGDALVIDATGAVIRKDWARPFSLAELLRLDFIPQATTFLRRSLIEQTGTLDVALHYSMDYDYWLRASLRHRFDYRSAEIARYRLHPESKSVSQIIRFNDEMVRVINRFFGQPDIPPVLRHKQRAVYADLMLLISTNYARTGQYRQAFAYLGKALRYHAVRPRMFWLLLRVLDTTLHVSASERLIESWHHLRNRVSQ